VRSVDVAVPLRSTQHAADERSGEVQERQGGAGPAVVADREPAGRDEPLSEVGSACVPAPNAGGGSLGTDWLLSSYGYRWQSQALPVEWAPGVA